MPTETLLSAETNPAVPGMVSVVLIFLNEQRYLAEAVESVRRQNYTNWELLLVDDGSTDLSPSIAKGYASADGRIRYLTHPGRQNLGMSSSRNLGLAHARGEYVAFLDGDDVYLPSRLGRHVEVLAEQPSIMMVASDHLRWFADAEPALGASHAVHVRGFFAIGDQVWKPPLGLMVAVGISYLGLGICNVTVRRAAAQSVGGFESQFTALYEDQAFTSKIACRFPVYVMQEYLARYRHHPASWTRRAKESGAVDAKVPQADTLRFAEWLLSHLQQMGIDDPLLISLIRARIPRSGTTPVRWQRAKVQLTAKVKRMLVAVAPRGWIVPLMVLDYQRDRRRAALEYARLAEMVSARALERALQSESQQ